MLPALSCNCVQRLGPAQQPALIIQQPLLSPAALAAAGALVHKLGLQLQQLHVSAAFLQQQQQQPHGPPSVSADDALSAAAAASEQALHSSTTTTTSSSGQSTVLVVSKLGVSAAELAAHLKATLAAPATSHGDSRNFSSSSSAASQQLTDAAAAAVPGASQLVGVHLHVSR